MADTNTASQRPWTWDFNDDDQRIIYDANGDCIAQVFNLDADAALIVEAVNGWTESARKPALAKPARNCDRYETWNDAWDAFDATYSGPTDPGEMDYRFSVWLFAKATKKGDGDDGK